MTKIEHDIKAAKDRVANYDKPYFHIAVNYLKENIGNNAEILDLGAGNGEFGVLAREKTGARVTCLDYAEPHLETLRSLGFETIKADFDKSGELKEVGKRFQNRFDVVTGFEFIEHIFGLDDFLTFAHTVLKPNGKIIISTPNLDYSFFHLYSLFMGNIPVGEGHHVRFFNRKRLTQALVLDGFDIVKELSHGRGTAYWDRMITPRNKLKEFLIRGLGRLVYELTPNSSSKKYRKLMIVGEKANVQPLGLDQTWREPNYAGLPNEDKQTIFSRLTQHKEKGLFNDMPIFSKFFENESCKYIKKC